MTESPLNQTGSGGAPLLLWGLELLAKVRQKVLHLLPSPAPSCSRVFGVGLLKTELPQPCPGRPSLGGKKTGQPHNQEAYGQTDA